MPDWFLPYTAAALVAAALGWLAFNYDPDAGSSTAKPALAGAPASGKPGTPQVPASAPADGGDAPTPTPAPAAEAPAAAPGEDAVRRLVETAMITDRASDCTKLYTQAFLEQIAGETGPDAVDDCRDNSDGDADSDSVVFNEVKATGGGYRVGVTLVGGEMGGTNFALTVVRDGPWKIDRLLSVDVDMEQLAAAAAAEAREEGANAEDAACLEGEVQSLSETDYERAIIQGRSEEYAKQMLGSTLGCLSAETLRRELTEGIRAGAGDAPEALIECVIDQIVSGKSAAELRSLLQMDQATSYELGRQAGIECAQMMGATS